ncbi:CoA pyrophosphatase [Paenalcaligenes sp. Me52]|uniref:CoA pyrophosphatase n=1 Tax=Paenalcaligenes sp. Me52 TaxID=3392038 RepID=UPI003D2CF719
MSEIMPTDVKRSTWFNPETQPVIAVDSLPSLAKEALQEDFIREAFKTMPLGQVDPHFQGQFVENFTAAPTAIPAAVYLGLQQRKTGMSMLFTRRSAHLLHHAGQISFPGGRIDPEDLSVQAAALRETHEEVGIDPDYLEPLGQQPIFLSSSSFAMCPVVGMIHPGYRMVPSPAEVSEVFEVPLSALLDPSQHTLHQVQVNGVNYRQYFAIRWQQHFIWGATAVIVRNFYHYLHAAHQRLA